MKVQYKNSFLTLILFEFLMLVLYNFGYMRDFNSTIISTKRSQVEYKFSENCKCFLPAMSNSNLNSEIKSTCSERATLRGPGQKVISYSLYSGKDTKLDVYFGGIEENLKDMRQIFPGWLMRIYTNVKIDENVCSLLCKNEDLYWCNVNKLPSVEFDLEKVHGMVWRTFPLGDEFVDKFLVRDLDSRITLRQIEAVNEWENSNYSFHVLRDHPQHNTPVLGSCWAVNNVRLGRERAKNYFQQFINKSWLDGPKRNNKYGVDQYLFFQVLYKNSASEWMAHDSYHCQFYRKFGENNRPFPTERLPGSQFEVACDCQRKGCNFSKEEIGECPVACRPKGKNWTYC